MIGFEIEYLRGVVAAADVTAGQEKDRVEWPPHPDRFFCALVQAWGDLGEPPEARRALERLERASPPLIRAGQLLVRNIVWQYVPVNDQWEFTRIVQKKRRLNAGVQGTAFRRERKARRFPQGTLAEPRAFLYWPDLELDTETLAALERVACQVSHVGHSSSFVRVTLRTTEPEGEWTTYRPDPLGGLALRVPYPGRLKELVEAYRRRKQRVSWPPTALSLSYGVAGSEEGATVGSHGEMICFRLANQGRQFPLESTLMILSTWRKALLAKAPQPVPEVISGHGADSTPENPRPSDRPHLALIPLPDVGHAFADGHLVGVAAVLPRAITAEERMQCLQTLAQVESLLLGRFGEVRLEPVSARYVRAALWARTWTRASTTWASVTPVVLGRFPKDLRSEESCRIVEEACEIAGLPRPIRIEVGTVSWVAGSVPAGRFPRPKPRPGKPARLLIHALLEFDRPVEGPVLVGAGKHLGYGLFRQAGDAH